MPFSSSAIHARWTNGQNYVLSISLIINKTASTTHPACIEYERLWFLVFCYKRLSCARCVGEDLFIWDRHVVVV